MEKSTNDDKSFASEQVYPDNTLSDVIVDGKALSKMSVAAQVVYLNEAVEARIKAKVKEAFWLASVIADKYVNKISGEINELSEKVVSGKIKL